MATDRIQHQLWRHLDPLHPLYDSQRSPAIAQLILNLYQQIDAAVGRIVAAAGDDALVIIMSDHGFNGCHQAFSVNAWLARYNWLALKRGASARGFSARVLRRLRQVPGLRQLKARLPGMRQIRLVEGWRPDATDWIDWQRTQAYFSDVGGIRINLRGREPEGIVPESGYESLCDTLTAGLLALRDPATGYAPVAAVHHREDLYHGEYVSLAPDLIIEPRRDALEPAQNYLLAYGAPPGEGLFRALPGLNGNHDLDGILFARGPAVTAGHIEGARLWDIAPTVCRHLGVPPPADLDGDVLGQLVDTTTRVGLLSAAAPFDAVPTELTSEDETALAAHLRALGYLS
jgi:predicted AlkP superfamily phosphohydrolase/phosphomutase